MPSIQIKIYTLLILAFGGQAYGEEQSSKKNSFWGTTLLNLGVAQTNFTELTEGDLYDKLYGKESLSAVFSAQRSFLKAGYLSFTYGLGFSQYQDSGYACKFSTKEECKNPPEADGDPRELDSPTTLSFYSFDFLVGANFALLSSKLLVLGGQFGISRSLYQEIRDSGSDADADDADSSKVFSNRFNKDNLLFGLDLMVRITQSSDFSTGLTTDALGLSNIYFSLFLKNYRPIQSDKLQLGRSMYGASFTFELI